MAEPIIRIENMVKSYKLGGETVMALRDVSIDIYEGDFVSVIGPSGSGKSTFMNMIGCLDRPDSGRPTKRRSCIRFKRCPMNNQPKKRLLDAIASFLA